LVLLLVFTLYFYAVGIVLTAEGYLLVAPAAFRGDVGKTKLVPLFASLSRSERGV
jgi:hypothetical protein